jgi:fructuronate reductase
MTRLSQATLGPLSLAIRRPAIRPAAVGIVHLGLGAFHRAHQVEYTDDALEAATAGRDGWGICGVSLKTPGARDRLVPQDCLYTLVKKSSAGIERRILGSLTEALFLGDAREQVQRRLAAPETAIVSLTITEKGYGHDPATGRLDPSHPEVASDPPDRQRRKAPSA